MLHKLTLSELQKKFTAGEVTAREIVRAYQLRINQVEPKVKAYITLEKESAMAQADAVDARLKVWRRTMHNLPGEDTPGDGHRRLLGI